MNKGELTNFKGVFTNGFDDIRVNSIVIPIIQRDYAQGRKSENVKRIRDRFISVLYEALTEDKIITLDFIYGNVDSNGKLTPLDGQQRLTTLFLLHYYIAQKEDIPEEEWNFLWNFTYETRISSREFCKHFLGYKPDFKLSTISDQIKDQEWFQMEWESDPTVQSMLVMLDTIHDKFNGTEGLWAKLTGDNIRFYFLSLEKIGVTDDIYIKMNSRGKALTPFEHFKAELELRMKEVDEACETNEKLADRISRKIDREWTDLLWPFRDSGTGSKQNDITTDDEFLRYIRFVNDLIGYRNSEEEIKDEFEIIRKRFSTDCDQARENLLLMEKLFDIWKGFDIEAFFHQFVTRGKHESGKIVIEAPSTVTEPENLFKECCRGYGEKRGQRSEFTLVQFLLLFSFIVYLENKEDINEDDFRRRLRIINNLVSNSQNTVRSEYMKELLSQTEKIIKTGVLEQAEQGSARFQTQQMQEEIEKLEWTKLHPELAEKLYELEDHPYLNGYIKAVGLDNVEWCDRFYTLFPTEFENRELKQQHLNAVNRALLSKAPYFEKDSWRHQIGTAHAERADGVWRELFSPRRLEDKLCHVLQELLSEEEIFTIDILQRKAWSFIQLSKERPINYYLIKYPVMQTGHLNEERYNGGYWGKFYLRNPKESNGVIEANSYKLILMTTPERFGYNYDIFLKTLYEMAGGEAVGLEIGNYSYSMYNNDDKLDKLRLSKQKLYLTLENNEYKVFNAETNEVIEVRRIRQNDKGIDVEDRVEVGLQLLNKYMNLFDIERIKEYINRCEWTFAKSMPQWPHEYIVKKKCPLSDAEFIDFVYTQRVLGEYEVWGNYYQPYLHIDGYKYWTMGCEIEDTTTVINRAKE